MSISGSFSLMLKRLKEGDEEAVRKLWDKFFEPLKQLARQRVIPRHRKSLDEEDLALSAINAFQKCVQNGKYEIDNSDDVWNFLVCITERKVLDHVRRETATKRGRGAMRGESFFFNVHGMEGGISQVEDDILDHEFAVDFLDQLQSLFSKLDSPELVQVITAKIEGYTVLEIAKQQGISVSSVERKLRLVRDIWREADRE